MANATKKGLDLSLDFRSQQIYFTVHLYATMSICMRLCPSVRDYVHTSDKSCTLFCQTPDQVLYYEITEGFITAVCLPQHISIELLQIMSPILVIVLVPNSLQITA